jgi:hypothetical protein
MEKSKSVDKIFIFYPIPTGAGEWSSIATILLILLTFFDCIKNGQNEKEVDFIRLLQELI